MRHEAATMNDIDLTHDEQVLYNRIVWDLEEMLARSYDEQQDVLDSADELVHLLQSRQAIPKIRLALFSDPNHNLAGKGKSPLQLLEQKGVTTRSAEFLKHLWFFIHGPRLPEELMDGVQRICAREVVATGDLVKEISSYIQVQFGKHHLGITAATEVEKLAHEIGYGRYAEQFRKAAVSAKR
jgi:hypothetical protein